MDHQYIYIIRRREHVRMDENIYKIGMTYRQGVKRLMQYDNGIGIEIYGMIEVRNAKDAETELKRLFNQKYDSALDITGSVESYMGDINEMMLDFHLIAKRFKRSKDYDLEDEFYDLKDQLPIINQSIVGSDDGGIFINEGEFIMDNIRYVALRRFLKLDGIGSASDFSIIREFDIDGLDFDPYPNIADIPELIDQVATHDDFIQVVFGIGIHVDLEMTDMDPYLKRAKTIYSHLLELK